MDDDISIIITSAQQQISQQTVPNRFLDLLDVGQVPRERLGWLAGELYRLVYSDRRSFALIAARFPAPPAGDLFLAMADGEGQALRLLLDFAAALGVDEQQLAAYEPRPLAQAYPAYLTQTALFGTRSDVASPCSRTCRIRGSGGVRTTQLGQRHLDSPIDPVLRPGAGVDEPPALDLDQVEPVLGRRLQQRPRHHPLRTLLRIGEHRLVEDGVEPVQIGGVDLRAPPGELGAVYRRERHIGGATGHEQGATDLG